MTAQKEIFLESDTIETLFTDDLNPFLKRGTAWMFLIGLSLLVLAYMVKWPNTINAGAVLTAVQNPNVVIPKVNGKLLSFSVANGDTVEAGQVIGMIENTAQPEDVKLLHALIDQVDSVYQTQVEVVERISIQYFELSQLGPMQPSYEQFLKTYRELKFALSDDFLSNKLLLLGQRISSLKQLNENLLAQKKAVDQDYELASAQCEKEKNLFARGSITAVELKQAESNLLGKRLSVENSKNSLIMNERQQQDMLEQKIQLNQLIENQKNSFIQSFKNLKSAYGEWRSEYVLTSPAAGIVSVPAQTQVGANISPQSPVVYVLPLHAEPVFHIRLPQNNLSEIDTTKLVRIKLASYPYEEYGVLEGKISSISWIPVEGQYEAIVGLPNGLKTSLDQHVKFLYGLEGDAEIIVSEERLLKRLFKSFYGKNKKDKQKEKISSP